MIILEIAIALILDLVESIRRDFEGGKEGFLYILLARNFPRDILTKKFVLQIQTITA